MDFFEKWEKKSELREKIRELRAQIKELQSQIRELKQLIDDYNVCKEDIGKAVDSWVTQKTAYKNILLEPVEVESYFEGTSAENAKSRLATIVASINSGNVTIANIKCAIPNQVQLIEVRITILEEEIKTLEEQIKTLETELNAL